MITRRSIFKFLSSLTLLPWLPKVIDAAPKPIVVTSVYAHKGEIVTCENGHQICEFARDVLYGQMMNETEKDFTNWQQDEPMIGALPKCYICGALWLKSGILFIGGKWRI